VVTMGQMLIRKGDSFEQSNNKYEFLEVDKNNDYNAKKRKITNIKPGIDEEDVVTMGQMLIRKGDGFEQDKNKYEFLEVDKNNEFNAKKRKITNIKQGTYKDDVAVVSQLLTIDDKNVLSAGDKKYEFLKVDNNEYNAKERKIINLKAGENKGDAVTVDQTLIRKDGGFEQLNNKYEFLELANNEFNAKNQKITNILPGTNDQDAVTISQVPIIVDDKWHLKSKIISHVKAGKDPNDCVVKGQAITLDDDRTKYVCKNKQIGNVARGTQPKDVVVKDQTITFDEVSRVFDGQKHRISNVHFGIFPGDVCTMAQAVIFSGGGFMIMGANESESLSF